MRQLAVILEEQHSVIAKIELRVRKLSALEYYQYCNALQLDPMVGIKIMENLE